MLIHRVFPALAVVLMLPVGCSSPEAPTTDGAKSAAAATPAGAKLPEVRYYMLSSD